MELFRSRVVTSLPDNLPTQQKDRLYVKGNIFNFNFQNNLAFCWMKKLSDSSKSKDLHA